MRPPRTSSSFDTTMPGTLPPDTSLHTLTIGILPTESFFHLPPLRSSPLCKKRQLASGVTHNRRSPTRSEKATHQTTHLKPGDWSTIYGGARSAIPPRRTTVRGFRNSSDNSTFTIHHSQFRFTLSPRVPRFTFHLSRPLTLTSPAALAPLGFLISLKLRTQNSELPCPPPYPHTPLPLYPSRLPPYPCTPSPATPHCSRFKRIDQFPIHLACIGNTSPLTTLPFNSDTPIIFHNCHLGSLPPPPIDFARQWNP